MKKSYIIIALAILAVLFFVLYLDSRSTIEYERESYSQSLLNYEADEFCLKIGLAYCRSDTQLIKEHSLADSLELPEFLEGADMAITGLQQTKYISDSKNPYATYFVDYLVISASTPTQKRSVRQTIHVEKNLIDGGWMFKALNYE